MRLLVTIAATCACVAALLGGAEARPGGVEGVWEKWRPVRGVTDLAGPRSDGRFVVAARGRLFLLRPGDGRLTAYPARGAPYRTNPQLEPYVDVAPAGQRVAAAGCTFSRDTAYAIEPAGKPAVIAVTPAGKVRRLARVPGVKTLNGIVFDTGGRYGRRLLVVGLTSAGRGVAATVDCRGRVRTLTRTAPHLEGGLAIAPKAFGAFGGQLIAPDELDGRLLAIAPNGRVRDVVDPGLPGGPDIGVESIGVVPAGARAAFLADRGVPDNPHPGNDAVLRLSGDALSAAGVRAGDLLVATEASATTIAVRCSPSCVVTRVASGPETAHGEGHIVFTR